MKIITVFKTHFDIGFTKLAREMMEEYSGSMLERVVDVCEATQKQGKALEYKWTMAAWPLHCALQSAEPSLRKRAEALIQRGQLLWHALPFTLHTELCTPEELIRSLRFSKELSDRYARPYPISAKMTDVPGHTRYLVSVLAKAGVKFLHLGCNPASTPPDVPMLFYWEAPDGERVLTFYNKTYGSSVLPPEEWPYNVWLNMCLTNDNVGPQGEQIIDEILQASNGVEMVVGSMDDFYRELSSCDLSNVPVIRGELSDTWIHGVGSYPEEVAMLCDARKKLAQAERAYALKAFDEKTEYLLEKAYEQSLLFCEHTWGLDVKTTLGERRSYEKAAFEKERKEARYLRLEASWNEQRLRARTFSGYADELYERYCGATHKEEQENPEHGYHIRFDGEKMLLFLRGKKLAEISAPVYHIAGKDELTNYERAYLRRLYFWAITDFGRLSYPETESEIFHAERYEFTPNGNGGVLRCFYPERASVVFGMAREVIIYFSFEDGVRINVKMEKTATPFLESCYLPVKLPRGEVVYHKTGGGVLQSEIVSNANRLANCVEKVTVGGVEAIPLHTPLLSRSKDLLCFFEPDYMPKDNVMNFNLFNNMWGTNFPQYIEGRFSFSFLIRPERKIVSDQIGKLRVQGGYIASVKKRKNGEIVRVGNQSPEPVSVMISGVDSLTPIDHFERLGKPLEGKNAFQIVLNPYEISSFLARSDDNKTK